MTNENDKNKLIKNLDMKNLSKNLRDEIISDIEQSVDINLNDYTLKTLQHKYQNKINNIIENKKQDFKDKILGTWYKREKSADDLIIFLLIIVLIGVTLFKFSSNVSNLIIFLLNKIILPNLLLIIISLMFSFIYIYKKNFLYNIFDFIIIWFKILNFQWLF